MRLTADRRLRDNALSGLRLLAFALLFSRTPSPSAHAEGAPEFWVSGFGTLGYAITDNNEVRYRRALGKDGADSSGTFKADSRLGVQVDAALHEHLSATVQTIVRQNYKGHVKPEVEWAYLKSQINDTYSVRIGRMADPLFIYSDIREVGYAHQSFRLPESSYSQSPVTNFNGLDLTAHYSLTTWDITARLFAGRKTFHFPNSLRAEIKTLYGLNLDFENSTARWRLGYSYVDIKLSSPYKDYLTQQLAALPIPLPSVHPFISDADRKFWPTRIINIGVEYDLDPWLVSAEWLRLDSEALTTNTESGYVTISRPLNSVTHYLSFSKLIQTSRTEIVDPGIPQLTELITAANHYFAPFDQETLALGFRWDFEPKVAFKAQYEFIRRDSLGAHFEQINESTPINNDDINMLSIGLDFIF